MLRTPVIQHEESYSKSYQSNDRHKAIVSIDAPDGAELELTGYGTTRDQAHEDLVGKLSELAELIGRVLTIAKLS